MPILDRSFPPSPRWQSEQERATPVDQQIIARRYAEEFARYMQGGEDLAGAGAPPLRPTHPETL
jgi:hypothetical protein